MLQTNTNTCRLCGGTGNHITGCRDSWVPLSEPTKFDVYTCLAGHSAARRYYRTYKTHAAAKAQATRLTGYGIIGIVEPR